MRLALLSCLLLCFCVGCSVTPPTATDVKLNSYFGDNMVLQRDMPIAVYGTAKGPGTVDVSLHSYGCQKYQEVFRQAQVDQTGRWRVELPRQNAGGPYALAVNGAGHKPVTFKNIMIGEVWVCSGQSNMEMQLKGVQDAEHVVAAADHPNIRLFVVNHACSDKPLEEPRGQWNVCTPQTAAEFSAVGYFFGQYLHRDSTCPSA